RSAAAPCALRASRRRIGDLSHRPPRRRIADRGGVAVAVLTDRLDYVVGKKAAGPLEEHFGIRTVNDLLRHYPRKYIDGTTVLGEGEDLEEGEHVTFVDVITKAEAKWTNRQPKREYLVVTLGHRRPKVTATFFNVKFLKKQL